MSGIYTDEEIEILQQTIINNIINNCLYCSKIPKVICKKKIPTSWCACIDTNHCDKCSDTNYCCPKQNSSEKIKITFTEDDKLFLIENLKTYKIIGYKIVFKSALEYSYSYATRTRTKIYIHYINIHGDVYVNNIIPNSDEYYTTFGVCDIIDYPFYIYQQLITTKEDKHSFNNNYYTTKNLSAKNNLQRRFIYDKYNYIYGTLKYIKKSFILPKYLLNIILESNYIDYNDYIDIHSMDNVNYKDVNYGKYYNQTDDNKKKHAIKNLNYKNNIYIKFMKYIINKNNKQYNSLFYNIDDLEKIDDIDTIHKKEIDEYYDNIDQEKLKQEELDRISKEKQDKIDKMQAELDKISKQDELDKKLKDKQDELDRINQINTEKKEKLKNILDELDNIYKQDELDKIIKTKQDELNILTKENKEKFDRIDKEKKDEIKRIAKETQERIIKEKQDELDKITRGNITIENNNLIIENNKYSEINLCELLPYKTKKICDETGKIKNVRYTEITHITFINCQFTNISKYFTGITHLIIKKCPNFKNISRYLKDEIKFLQINNEILIDEQDDDDEDEDEYEYEYEYEDIEDDDNDNATMSL